MGIVDKVASKARKGKVVTLDGEKPPRSGGKKLPPKYRQILGDAYDADFSEVRIHTDELAEQLCESLEVDAFTQGDHIFIAGSLRLDLLAHEANHVVQQREGKTLKGAKVMVRR